MVKVRFENPKVKLCVKLKLYPVSRITNAVDLFRRVIILNHAIHHVRFACRKFHIASQYQCFNLFLAQKCPCNNGFHIQTDTKLISICSQLSWLAGRNVVRRQPQVASQC